MVGERNDKVVTVAFVVILVASILAYIYVSLPKFEEKHQEKVEFVITIRYGDEIRNYTLDEIKAMPSLSGLGGYVKKNNVTVGPDFYKGVEIGYILKQFSLPENYSIVITAKDGYEKEFSPDLIEGKIDVYDENATYLGKGNVTMIIAYEKNNESLSEDEGPLRVAFVSDEGYLTPSKYWIKSIASIEIKVQ